MHYVTWLGLWLKVKCLSCGEPTRLEAARFGSTAANDRGATTGRGTSAERRDVEKSAHQSPCFSRDGSPDCGRRDSYARWRATASRYGSRPRRRRGCPQTGVARNPCDPFCARSGVFVQNALSVKSRRGPARLQVRAGQRGRGQTMLTLQITLNPSGVATAAQRAAIAQYGCSCGRYNSVCRGQSDETDYARPISPDSDPRAGAGER